MRRRIMVLAGVVVLTLAIFGFNSTSNAQQSGSGLQVSPTRTEISGASGELKTFTINLKNITKGGLTAKAFINDFESDNSSGTPQIIVDPKKEASPYSISKMIRGLQDVELQPGETKQVKLAVDIPAGVSPGAYFGAVRYAAVPKGQTLNEQDRQVALTASVAHLVFVEVPGNIVEQIKIENLQMQSGDKKGWFFLKTPTKANVTVKNLGNGFSRPFGKVSISRTLGGQVYSYDVNSRDPRGIVLPNSSRVFTDDIKNVKVPGKYTATASIAYGNGGEVVNYKSSFWYIPVWLLILLTLLFVAVVTFIVLIYRKKYTFHRKKKK